MKILVLGGSGFLGSFICDALTKKGHQVTIFDQRKSPWIKKSQKMIVGNISNLTQLKKAIMGKQIIFNFAALSDLDEAKNKPIETVKSNILGTINALVLAKKYKIKRFIHASSIYASSEEGGFYSCSKRSAENYIEEFQKSYDLDFTILRFGSIYGQRSGKNNGVTKLIFNAIENKNLRYHGTKKATRRYIHVLDCADACTKIISPKYKNKYLTITGKKLIKITDFLNFLSKQFNLNKKKITYLNKQKSGHYNTEPTPYKLRIGEKYVIKKPKNFKKSILELIKEYKNE
jgi:UDP-glucose 4-epimerase